MARKTLAAVCAATALVGISLISMTRQSPIAGASWEVPAGGTSAAGYTNTGLGWDGTDVLIGNFTNSLIQKTTTAGVYVGEIVLGGSPPANSVQGVTWDSSRSHYWVAHYAASGASGSLRRYNAAGTLQDTITTANVGGPNGIIYDAANDRILACFDDGHIRGYDCTDGSLDEDITTSGLGTGSGQGLDGIDIDPGDATRLWVSSDITTGNRVAKINRATGATVSYWLCPINPEGLKWISGSLYLCCDQAFHSSVTNGNRVWALDSNGLTTSGQSVQAKVVNFSLGGSGLQSVTGVGFVPRAVIFYGAVSGSGATALNAAGAADFQMRQWCMSDRAADNVGTSDAYKVFSTAACFNTSSGSATNSAGSAVFHSVSHDGFILSVTNPAPNARSICALVIGGDDVQAKVGTFDMDTSTTQAITGVGFLPKLVIGSLNLGDTTEGVLNSEARFGLGVMTATAQWVVNSYSRDNLAASDDSGVGRTDGLFTRINTDLSTAILASYSSLDADGFTITKSPAPGANLRCGYVALGGDAQYAAGAFTQPNSTTGNQAVTGVGFTPAAVMFASAGRTASTSPSANSRILLGAATSSSNRMLATSTVLDAADPTDTARYENLTNALAAISDGGTPTVLALADYVSNDADGFTVNWTTCDATQRQNYYLAIGAAESPSGGLLRTIILLSQFDRIHKQQSHFDTYGVYSIAP